MADFFRFWWSLVSLNGRKTAFRLRRGRGRCPCQSPSDSGRAGVTHCEEAAMWNKPARLRRVCPHLRQGPDGWRCGVNTADVRPFWGRAAAWFGGAAVAAYLVAALSAFVYLRSIGYASVTPLDTMWPQRWSRVTRSRSEFFLHQAKTALSQMDERAMRVSLASAAAAAKDHYEARLAIAQIYSFLAVRNAASQSFTELLADFPAERTRTAVAFHDALLVSRQFDELGALALSELARQPGAEATVWLRGVFGALRGSQWPEQLLTRHADNLERLPEAWRDALKAEARVRATRSIAGFSARPVPLASEHAALLILMGETFAELAPPAAAIDEIIRMAPAIGNFERDRLLYRLHARVGADKAALQAFDAMLRGAGRPAQRERLLAALVEFPHADRIERLVGAASNPRAPFTPAELGSLWVAASACDHAQLRSLALQRLRAHYAVDIEATLPAKFTVANAVLWVRVLPMGRETVWSLVTKVSPRPADLRTATN